MPVSSQRLPAASAAAVRPTSIIRHSLPSAAQCAPRARVNFVPSHPFHPVQPPYNELQPSRLSPPAIIFVESLTQHYLLFSTLAHPLHRPSLPHSPLPVPAVVPCTQMPTPYMHLIRASPELTKGCQDSQDRVPRGGTSDASGSTGVNGSPNIPSP